ncbi:MAG: 2-oxoacid:acceptor oxidoreductase family protein, partial [Desulfobacterales bacterium]|nr:2-oxoacid:acceptor oxidoreductase family protein [Desulfobacterales bacterium]
LAKQAGNIMSLNMVLLGSLIQTGIMPVSADDVKEAIRTSTKKAFVDINIKAFDLGFEAAAKAA